MARPLKEGLDYFPLDVDIDQDDKIAMIEALHGAEGFAVVIKLLMKIYKEGYAYEWNKREQILFSKRVNVDINSVEAIVNDCINEGLFNKNLYEQYNVLTSKGIQSRYLEAVKRRKEVNFNAKYFLISDIKTIVGSNKIDVFTVNDDGKRVNVNINTDSVEVNVNKSTQRKEKESKEKKSKEHKDSIVEIINYLNSVCDKKFKPTTEGQVKFIRARLNEGNTVEDLKSVIDKKSAQWLGSKHEMYLRPSTLFNSEKFESYLNEKSKRTGVGTKRNIESELNFDE
jgi:uncharacterized phage protein (TIGR02220 family)